jgi:glycosyltransferase involved in cell wall biosynthesis
MTGHDTVYFDPSPVRIPDALYEEPLRQGLSVVSLPKARLFRTLRLSNYVNRTLRTKGFGQPVLWVTSPEYSEPAKRVERSALIYDASEGVPPPGDKTLAGMADVILVSTAAQEARVKPYGKPTLLLPNGVPFELFHREENLPFPDDLFNVRNPIIGHLGALDRDVDLRYIEASAKAQPDWSFVFVGPVTDADVTPLEGLRNVFLLGHKPHKTLPVYVSRFDVCVNIARNIDASPMKLYSYLATGKPVVSTPHPAQTLDYTEVLTIAATHGEFIAGIRKALRERDAWRVRRRIEYGRAASWDARIANLERTMKELGIF